MEHSLVGNVPLPVAAVVSAATRRSMLRHDGSHLYWLEQRPEENGRGVIMRWSATSGSEEVLPTQFNVRSRVHEYGGGEFAVHNGAVVFIAEPDQQIWLRTANGELRALTHASQPARSVRYADFCWHPDGEWCYAIRERHQGDDVINDLVAVSLSGEIHLLASGADFYASPVVSPDGTHLAWLQWSHPAMPWDGTQLVQAVLLSPNVLQDQNVVAGGEDESVLQPWFTSDNCLFALSDRSGYWQPGMVLERGWQPLLAVATHSLPPSQIALFESTEFAVAPWSLGTRTWCKSQNGDVWLIGSHQGFQQLWQVSPDRDNAYKVAQLTRSEVALTSCLAPQLAVIDDALFVLESGAERMERLVALRPGISKEASITRGTVWPADVAITPAQVTSVEMGARRIPVILYRPASSVRCPLLVFCHSGPTGSASPALQPAIQFWTSRGYIVADVNYRGSDGFGRSWRQSLLGHWGEYDVADCLAVVEALLVDGSVDPNRVYLRGNSAGGLTVLRMLARSPRIRAAALRYPVVDLTRLAAASHKFEARYLHRLVGATATDEQRLLQMSPASIFDQLSTPILVQQGDLDPVVPLAQAELLVESLRRAGIDHDLKVHVGEGHGFRRADTVSNALETEFAFFQRYH